MNSGDEVPGVKTIQTFGEIKSYQAESFMFLQYTFLKT